jgi:tRNA-guanine family transglycosylase
MGVGYLVDVVICSCLGVDMFDCVFPTRTARFGTVFTSRGEVDMRNSEHALSFEPI